MENVYLSYKRNNSGQQTGKRPCKINISLSINGHHSDSFFENAPFELLKYG